MSTSTEKKRFYLAYSAFATEELKERSNEKAYCLAFHTDKKGEGEIRMDFIPDDLKVCAYVKYPDGRVRTLYWYTATYEQMSKVLEKSDTEKMSNFFKDMTITHIRKNSVLLDGAFNVIIDNGRFDK